jgi:isopentenyl diphosphate isomerase/L-lactate dehydrogenase-like FMN-dependent dehydrogenase
MASASTTTRRCGANRDGFQKFQLPSARLVDVGKLDTRLEAVRRDLWQPDRRGATGSNRAFTKRARLAVSRAAPGRQSL